MKDRLPRLGYLMRQADVFIDGKARPSGHDYEYEPRPLEYQLSGSQWIDEALVELKRTRGAIIQTASALGHLLKG